MSIKSNKQKLAQFGVIEDKGYKDTRLRVIYATAGISLDCETFHVKFEHNM